MKLQAIAMLTMMAALAEGRGQSPEIRIVEGRPVVDCVFVNGHGPYRFLVDTGTNVNLIETGLARTIGMKPTFQADLTTSIGTIQTVGSDGNEVALDLVKAGGQKFVFSGMEAVHKLSPDIHGVLGQWFLAQFDYLLDLRSKRLEFGKQDRRGTRTPFEMVNARPVISTNLGALALDSAANRVILFGVHPDLLSHKAELRTVAGSRQIGTVSGQLLCIEGRKFWRGEAVAILERSEPGVDGLMPLSAFKTIYVCNSEGYVVFE